MVAHGLLADREAPADVGIGEALADQRQDLALAGRELVEGRIVSGLARSRRDPIAPILARKDTLRLTDAQVADLQKLSATFTATTDSLLAPVVEYVVKKGKRVTDQDLSPKMSKATQGISRATAEALTKATALLTPGQRALIAPMPGTRPGPMVAPPAGVEAPRGGGMPIRIGGGGQE